MHGFGFAVADGLIDVDYHRGVKLLSIAVFLLQQFVILVVKVEHFFGRGSVLQQITVGDYPPEFVFDAESENDFAESFDAFGKMRGAEVIDVVFLSDG